MTQHTARPLETHRSARSSRRRAFGLASALALVLGLGMSSGAHAVAAPLSACILGLSYTNVSCGIDVDGLTGYDVLVVVNSQTTTPYAYLSNTSGSNLVFLGLSTTNFSSLKRLNAGDVVDAAAFSAGGIANSGYAYGLLPSLDQWAAVGDTGYVGFRTTSTVGSKIVYNYGYIGLTRGSLTVNNFAYQTTAGQAAQIPSATATVPEPASLALVVAAAGGMLAARRRKAGAAAAR